MMVGEVLRILEMVLVVLDTMKNVMVMVSTRTVVKHILLWLLGTWKGKTTFVFKQKQSKYIFFFAIFLFSSKKQNNSKSGPLSVT